MRSSCFEFLVAAVCLATVGLLGSGERALADEPAGTPPPLPGNREHVYIFMINGMTVLPHIYGSMNPLGKTLQQHGYVHSETATHYWRRSFENKIRAIHKSDPQARIVLVGYSIGSSVIHSMARTFEQERIPIALMVYLDGHSVLNNLDERFSNVDRVVCLTSSAFVLRGTELPHADFALKIKSSRHLSVPKKDTTMQTLLSELDAVAASVPRPIVTSQPDAPTVPASLVTGSPSTTKP